MRPIDGINEVVAIRRAFEDNSDVFGSPPPPPTRAQADYVDLTDTLYDLTLPVTVDRGPKTRSQKGKDSIE